MRPWTPTPVNGPSNNLTPTATAKSSKDDNRGMEQVATDHTLNKAAEEWAVDGPGVRRLEKSSTGIAEARRWRRGRGGQLSMTKSPPV